MTKARLNKDMNDTFDILRTVKQMDSFGGDTSLRGLFSGVTAEKSVYVDNAGHFGQAILNCMVGISVQDFFF